MNALKDLIAENKNNTLLENISVNNREILFKTLVDGDLKTKRVNRKVCGNRWCS